jgi:hypothetical protein
MSLFDLLSTTCVPFILYAETHYRIPGIYNRLFRPEPEIVIDVPHRLQGNGALPILLIIKDSHRFPVTLARLRIFIDQQEYIFVENLTIQKPFWHKIYTLQPEKSFAQVITVHATVELLVNRRPLVVHNDNFFSAGHQPFRVERDPLPLPGSEHCCWSDLHCHSCYTNDQMEFGPPLDAIKNMAEAIGLQAVAVTDHSYDLDDLPNDYLVNDPQLSKWQALQDEVQSLNKESGPVLIHGEEVSVGNGRRQNVHMLILNDPVFYPGMGDSGEKWLQTEPHISIPRLLSDLSPHAVAFAAHPKARPPWPQRLLLGRDQWYDQDCEQKGLHGLQIWNGEEAAGFEEGLACWTRQLLNGQRLTIIGGNDSHGDFNRVRHIKIPFWTILESYHHLFGRVRTGILTPTSPSSHSELLQALSQGRCIISNGPFAQMTLAGKGIGETVTEKCSTLFIQAISTPAFGFLVRVDVYVGDLKKKQEDKRTFAAPPACLLFQQNIYELSLPDQGYIRLQAFSDKNGRRYQCLTNPVYLSTRTV